MAVENDSPPPTVRPQPGMVKTIGIFNLLFGGLLSLCGMGCGNWFVQNLLNEGATPPRTSVSDLQLILNEFHNERIANLRELERNAPTAEAKARLKAQRQEVEATRPRIEPTFDIAKVNAGLAATTRYLWADIASAPFLNLLMLLSGLGLLLRKNWGRLLAIVTAVLKIVRLIALCFLLLIDVLPKTAEAMNVLADSQIGKELVTSATEQMNAQNGGLPPGAQFTPRLITQYLQSFSSTYAFLLPCLGSIYPAITLVLLTRPGARAACQSRDEEETRDEP